MGERVAAEERDRSVAGTHVRHLVVVLQPGADRRADLVHVRGDVVVWVRPAVVGAGVLEHFVGEVTHRLQIGEPRVDDVHESDRIERGADRVGQRVESDPSCVERERRRVGVRHTGPPLRLDERRLDPSGFAARGPSAARSASTRAFVTTCPLCAQRLRAASRMAMSLAGEIPDQEGQESSSRRSAPCRWSVKDGPKVRRGAVMFCCR